MDWSDQIYVMLQTLEMVNSGKTKNIADPKWNTIATVTIPVESLNKLNEMIKDGLEAGGTELTPTKDEGFLQARNLEDLDGHHWGIILLDMN